MAIAIGNVATASNTGSSPASWSHTIAAGSNRALYVVQLERFADTYTCDWNGTGLTLVASKNNGTAARVAIYRLIAPATGTFNVTLTASGTVRRWVACSIDLTGVDQATPESNIGLGSSGTSTTPNDSVTSAVGELVIGGMSAQNDTNTITGSADAGETELVNLASSNGTTNGVRGIASREAGAAGSVSNSYTITSALWAAIAISVKAAVTTTPSGLTLLGAG